VTGPIIAAAILFALWTVARLVRFTLNAVADTNRGTELMSAATGKTRSLATNRLGAFVE
jgi:hypothetical protein